MQAGPSDDRPRLLRDTHEIEKRRALLSQPQIAPLADFVRALRAEDFGEVPDFDPWDGGIEARILFLFEKPGPKALVSGFISRDNDDQTAENTFNFMRDAGIPREQSCTWNVIPGWNGTIDITAPERRAGLVALDGLTELLTDLAVVVLVGRKAAKAALHMRRAGLPVLESMHPSPKNRASRPDKWARIPEQWAEAKKFL